MKSYLVAVGAASLATGLSVLGCKLVGMPRADLGIAALVAGSVSICTAVTAVVVARRRQAG